ncbi:MULTISPECIES: hypothetical protein [Streptomyces]|uniref:hypothetical protein n=1 Tax=Streptomyces TaxID=1883 RepID=UPI001318F188|nr:MULTISPECIES: hypothetical protein [Streptomyces]QGZ51923.1 hypothetical protein GPZ77_29300 [Streptomyces sp. QHH-9511]GGT71684.1 hypothetical protein GCM10010272_13430 [Streptomyces lateritius]
MANQTLRSATVRAAAKRAERAERTRRSNDGRPAATPVLERTEPAESAVRPVRRPGTLGAVLAALVVLAVAATATLGLRYREADRTAAARTAALAEARKAAPAILSYDYRHLDRDFAAARAHLTGPFLDEYGKTTSTVVAPTARTYHGVVKATVAKPPTGDAAPAASVVSASPEKVVVLLFMNQVTTSTQVATPRLDLNRVRMTLVHTPQGWKVSAVDAL